MIYIILIICFTLLCGGCIRDSIKSHRETWTGSKGNWFDLLLEIFIIILLGFVSFLSLKKVLETGL